MNDEKNESNRELDADSQQEINLPADEFSVKEDTESKKLGTEEVITGEITSLPVGSNTIPPSTEKPKRNRYKIAFFTLGSVIILGTALFFGYQYMKNREVPVTENLCLDTDTKIYDAYKDAVVLIRHKYGYFAKINGVEFQLTVPEATEEILYGTGFFVDNNGNMLTNSHVLQPWNSTDEQREKINNNIRNMQLKIASILTTDISEDGYESFILRNWDSASSEEIYDEGHESEGEIKEDSGEEFVTSSDATADSTTETTDLAASIPQKEYVSSEDIEVYVKTIDITVALHNSNDEWLNSNIVKISDNSDIDLGIVQLSNKKTPESVTNIININNSITDDQALNPGQKAIMIGYPLGVDLAQTSSGIKVQLYNGQISKESDGNKIQYSITSTHGASGAPVFNDCGQLIAVNFSGIDQIQGFNFGIVAKHVNTFMAVDSPEAISK